MLKKTLLFREILILFLLVILSNLLVYAFFLKDINVVGRYLDGPHYLEVAKTFYSKITPDNPAKMPEWYFGVHLIAFPFFIRIFSLILPDILAILTAVALFTGLATVFFYLLLKQAKYVKNPLWFSLIFIFFPPRWLLYHAVPGSEPLFMFFALLSLYLYKKKKFLGSIIAAVGSTLTRIFGILFFPLYFFLFLREKKRKEVFLSFLIPMSLLFHFSYYYFRFGDFFAYFRWNVKQIRAFPFVTQIILRIAEDKTAVAEFFILMSVLTIVGIFRLKKFKELFWYSLLFFLPIPLLIQVDFSRFFIPIFPFAWLVAFERLFDSKIFKIIFIPLVIVSYIYVIRVIPTNLFSAEAFESLIKGRF